MSDRKLSDLTSHCIRCGFCLESCPTFVLTGQETESPRGRIYLARTADEGKLDWKEDVGPHLDQCLGCRACETACPSGVEYGAILEMARTRVEEVHKHRAKRMFLDGLSSPTKMRIQLGLSKIIPGKRIPAILSRILSGQAPEADKPTPQPSFPWPPLDEAALPEIKGQVYMLEGCVMRVMYPNVHEATRRLMRRIGYAVKPTSSGCCGALHAHNGFLEVGQEYAKRLAETMPADLPIIVNSAGCGSHMKEQAAFGDRVKDISEFFVENGLLDLLSQLPEREATATYHDACHLVHGQKIRIQPRQLLNAIPGLELIEMPEADMCCGSAGIYNVTQPKLARELLERKYANAESTGASLIVMGNPGCHGWIAQAVREHGERMKVLHLAEMLEQALSGVFPEG